MVFGTSATDGTTLFRVEHTKAATVDPTRPNEVTTFCCFWVRLLPPVFLIGFPLFSFCFLSKLAPWNNGNKVPAFGFTFPGTNAEQAHPKKMGTKLQSWAKMLSKRKSRRRAAEIRGTKRLVMRKTGNLPICRKSPKTCPKFSSFWHSKRRIKTCWLCPIEDWRECLVNHSCFFRRLFSSRVKWDAKFYSFLYCSIQPWRVVCCWCLYYANARKRTPKWLSGLRLACLLCAASRLLSSNSRPRCLLNNWKAQHPTAVDLSTQHHVHELRPWLTKWTR